MKMSPRVPDLLGAVRAPAPSTVARREPAGSPFGDPLMGARRTGPLFDLSDEALFDLKNALEAEMAAAVRARAWIIVDEVAEDLGAIDAELDRRDES